MADVHNPSPFRFAREVAPNAPKPGHHLATASFQMGKDAFVLWVIEGPPNDAFSFLGFSTNFETTRKLRFAIRGPLIEKLNDLPQSTFDRGLSYRFRPAGDEQPSRLLLDRATTVFSSLRSPNRIDPDSAAIAYELVGGDRVVAMVTGYQRGWYWQAITPAIGLAIWALRTDAKEGDTVRLAVEQDSEGPAGRFEVTGTAIYRESILAQLLEPPATTVPE